MILKIISIYILFILLQVAQVFVKNKLLGNAFNGVLDIINMVFFSINLYL